MLVRSIRERPEPASWSSTTRVGSSPTPTHDTNSSIPEPGWVEHDPMEIWENTQWCCTRPSTTRGFDASQLEAIGVTNQRETTLFWDADSRQTDPPSDRLAGPPDNRPGREVRGRREGRGDPGEDRPSARRVLLGHQGRVAPRQHRPDQAPAHPARRRPRARREAATSTSARWTRG